jgi:O-antigen/teichoic acid export membrane protein
MAIQAMNKDYGKNWFFARSQSRAPLKETLHFAVSTNLSATVKTVASESWPLWLGVFLDAGSVGIFKVAMSIVNLLTIPITPLISTAFPDITRSVVAKKWQELRKLLKQITLLATAWTVPASLFMILLGKWLVWIFGKDYPGSYGTLLFLLLGYSVTNIFFWNRTLLLAFGKANIPLYILAVGAVIKIGLAFIVIPKYGVNGEAALLSGYFTMTTLVMIWVGYNKIRSAESVEPTSEVA